MTGNVVPFRKPPAKPEVDAAVYTPAQTLSLCVHLAQQHLAAMTPSAETAKAIRSVAFHLEPHCGPELECLREIQAGRADG
jgi:hypothetical protein